MDDPVRSFFEGIGGTYPSVPRTISGALRFDLEGDPRVEHWRVTFADGTVSAVESDAPADCVAIVDRQTFSAIVHGRLNAMVAVLRGAVRVEGDLLLLGLFRAIVAARGSESRMPLPGPNAGRS